MTSGHGRSPVPAGPHSIADLGGDVLALMDRLKLARAAYCGVSIGGMVGQWLAVNAPDRIERLILICTALHMPPASAWHERAAAVRAAGSPRHDRPHRAAAFTRSRRSASAATSTASGFDSGTIAPGPGGVQPGPGAGTSTSWSSSSSPGGSPVSSQPPLAGLTSFWPASSAKALVTVGRRAATRLASRV